MVGRPSRMAGCGQEALSEGWEWLGGLHGGSGGTTGGSRVVGSPSRMAGSGQEAFTEDWEWSGVPPVGSRVVWSPSRRAGSDREALP